MRKFIKCEVGKAIKLLFSISIQTVKKIVLELPLTIKQSQVEKKKKVFITLKRQHKKSIRQKILKQLQELIFIIF